MLFIFSALNTVVAGRAGFYSVLLTSSVSGSPQCVEMPHALNKCISDNYNIVLLFAILKRIFLMMIFSERADIDACWQC